ncbi:MAG: DUF3194 domain-containing protein [Candidatus Thorarchaeota archaeon]|nr:DUF3194 domain-containing protein [Candidatus Thorarchaeota archaeon]
MREMRPEADEIGLPNISEKQIELLAEECEAKITEFIFRRIPKKSIAELTVSCSVHLSDKLDLDIDIDISQNYESGGDLNDLIDEAAEHGTAWLEKCLKELKSCES